jgi:hypothetical protein
MAFSSTPLLKSLARMHVELYWKLRASPLLRSLLAPTYRQFRYSPRVRRSFGPTYRWLRSYALAASGPPRPVASAEHLSLLASADLHDVRLVLAQLQQDNERLTQRYEALAQQVERLDVLLQRNFAVNYLQLITERDPQQAGGPSE